MIAYIKGKPKVYKNYLIVSTNNIGYLIYAGNKLLTKAQLQDEIELFTYTHVKEDKLELYGFQTHQELELFKLVINISGIGPKTGLDILDAGPAHMIEAVQQADTNFFKSIPRIGKKTAQKIIIELKSKLGSIKEINLGPISPQEKDLREALNQLGFEDNHISQVISKVDLEDSLQTNLQKCLKFLAK